MKLIALILCIFIGACNSKEPWQLTNISGHLPDLKFEMTDDNGRKVTEKDYQGNIILLYFGFARCPDECPLTMARLKQILPQAGANIRVLFVTIDPQNDRPQVLHDYLAKFDGKHMVGLTGDAEIIAKRYRAAYQNGEDVHSNVIYIFGKNGQARLLATPEDPDEKIIHDLRLLNHAD